MASASSPTSGLARSTDASSDAALRGRLDEVIDHAIAEERIVGTAVVVVRDGRVVYRRAAGFADREAGRPMQMETVFRLASMTKLVVSTAALAPVEAKVLRLDDPVTKYFPEFRPRLPNGKTPTITVRHLLTHTAGLDYGFEDDGPFRRENVSNGIDRPGLSFEENLSRLARVPLLYEPGTIWKYSMATDVLGGIVAKAGGAPLPEVVHRLVTGPLAMDHTSFTAPSPDSLAVPYADGAPRPSRMADGTKVTFFGNVIGFAPSRAFDPRSYPSGGGGMVGTADDFVRLLETPRPGDSPKAGRDDAVEPRHTPVGRGLRPFVFRRPRREAHRRGDDEHRRRRDGRRLPECAPCRRLRAPVRRSLARLQRFD